MTNLNWQRHSGYTQTLNTGPSSDHTLGKYKPLLSKRSRYVSEDEEKSRRAYSSCGL